MQKYTINGELRLISGSSDLSIKIWNATTVDFILIKTIDQAHSQEIYCFVILPNVYYFLEKFKLKINIIELLKIREILPVVVRIHL